MSDWADVAVLVKKKNAGGRLVAQMRSGLPAFLEEGMEVHFVPPQLDAPRHALIQQVKSTGDRIDVAFAEVGEEEAVLLVGCHCLVERRLVPDRRNGSYPDVSDWQVRCDGALIGTVSEIRENPGQLLLVVKRAEGSGSVLIPLVDEFVESIDEDARVLGMALPEGLLEL